MSFELYCFDVPLRVPFRTSQRTYRKTSGIIVRAVAEDGLTGLGEISTFGNSPHAILPSSREAARELENLFERTNHLPVRDDLQRLVDQLHMVTADPAVNFGFETAAADLFSKQAGLPLAKWLDSSSEIRIAANGLLFGSMDEIAVQIAYKKRRGFGCYKLKVGLGEIEEDIQLVSQVRSLVGASVTLRVDANSQWKSSEVRDILGRLSGQHIEYFEDPTQWQILPWVKEETGVPLALDFRPYMEDSLEDFIAHHSIDVLVIKPSQVGGILNTLSLSRKVARAGVKTVISSNLETGVGIAACLHLTAAISSGLAAGLDTLNLLDSTLIDQALPIVDGCMSVPLQKGLGVELNCAAGKYLQRVDL